MNEKEIKELRFVMESIIELYGRLMMVEKLGSDLDLEKVQLKMECLRSMLGFIEVERMEVLEKVGFDLKEAIGKPLNELLASFIIDLKRKDS